MFIGEYSFNIDESHRLSIPNAFKKELLKYKDSLVLAKGFEKCLYLFTKKSWEELADKVNSLSITKSINRKFSRSFISGAFEAELDAKGRICVNQKLLDYSGIKKECLIMGVGTRIEIWDVDEYNKYLQENPNIMAELGEGLEL